MVEDVYKRQARDKEEVVVNETFAEMMRWGDDVVGRTVYLSLIHISLVVERHLQFVSRAAIGKKGRKTRVYAVQLTDVGKDLSLIHI